MSKACLSVSLLVYMPSPVWSVWFVLVGHADLSVRAVSGHSLVLPWTWSTILQVWAARLVPSECITLHLTILEYV